LIELRTTYTLGHACEVLGEMMLLTFRGDIVAEHSRN
jgi:hypothetical protein